MKTSLKIQNLKCGGCEKTITDELNKLLPEGKVTVDTDKETVSFNYQKDADLEAAKETLSRLGYPIAGDKNSVIAKATSYVSCVKGRIK